jgi:hypothetical protein
MTGALSYVILAPLFGKLVDLLSLAKAHIILGIYFLGYGALALLVFLRLFTDVKVNNQNKEGSS